MAGGPIKDTPIEDGFFVRTWVSFFIRVDTGLTETLTFGGGASGEVATLTLEDGRVTGKTLVP